MSEDLILFWHRRDLRIQDNLGLLKACEFSSKVIGLFCLDPNFLKRDDIAAVRVTYMIGCLQFLQEEYKKLGSQLLILQGEPQEIIPKLARELKAKAVYFNLDIEPFARNRDRNVSEALTSIGIRTETTWDQLLHTPDQILTQSQEPYKVYTPFWRNWSLKPKAKPQPVFSKPLIGLTETEQELAQNIGVIPLPSAQELGFIWDNFFYFNVFTFLTLLQLHSFPTNLPS